jgi:hypothetical protein
LVVRVGLAFCSLTALFFTVHTPENETGFGFVLLVSIAALAAHPPLLLQRRREL